MKSGMYSPSYAKKKNANVFIWHTQCDLLNLRVVLLLVTASRNNSFEGNLLISCMLCSAVVEVICRQGHNDRKSFQLCYYFLNDSDENNTDILPIL